MYLFVWILIFLEWYIRIPIQPRVASLPTKVYRDLKLDNILMVTALPLHICFAKMFSSWIPVIHYRMSTVTSQLLTLVLPRYYPMGPTQIDHFRDLTSKTHFTHYSLASRKMAWPTPSAVHYLPYSCSWNHHYYRLTFFFSGTPVYISPEVLLKKKYGHVSSLWASQSMISICVLNPVFWTPPLYLMMKAVDWWATGTVLYEISVGRTPFQDR